MAEKGALLTSEWDPQAVFLEAGTVSLGVDPA
jgi:hypothetical protein